MTVTPPRTNYLNNRDLLLEIHASKRSYCSFLDSETDHQYDMIVPSVSKINRNTIAEAKRNRSERLKKENRVIIDPKKIAVTDLVFRVVCWDHIPMSPPKEPKSKPKKLSYTDVFDFGVTEIDFTSAMDDVIEADPESKKHVVLNFPPFWHYRIDENKQPYVVGKSHWKGDLETGEFCMTHGRITHKLATMFLKLCERYASRSNWRSYCVDTETQALTKRGWLGMAEINEDDTILSYHDGRLTWSAIKSIYRGEFNGMMHKITSQGIDALVTPEHKFVTKRGLVKVEHIKRSDGVVIMGDHVESPVTVCHSDTLVELVGWIITEGSWDWYGRKSKPRGLTIYQNAGPNADRIRNCLVAEGLMFSERQLDKLTIFRIWKQDSDKIHDLIPDKDLTMEFILSLTQHQREILIDAMVSGDGWIRPGNQRSYSQKNQSSIDFFQALLTIAGTKSNYHHREITSFGKPTSIYTVNLFSARKNITPGERLDLHGGLNNGAGTNRARGKESFPNVPTVPYEGMVWCPETEYGSFVARRNGKVYLTGNSYKDEMQCQALLQLTESGLKFDESKGKNPFAYYTCCVANSFTKILNNEKRVQNIRDDVLEINGLTPSWTRQNAGVFEAQVARFNEE